MRRALAAALAAAVLTACAPGSNGIDVGSIDIDLDSQALRVQKEKAGIEPCVAPTTEPAADGLPEVTLECLGGGPAVDVSRLRGPLVVNLFASWCGPCRRELPILADFHDRNGDRVPVLGVDWNDFHPDAALDLVSDSGVTYPLVADPGTEMGEAGLRLRGIPVVILIDADGDIAYQHEHEITSRAELEELVARHLGVDL